MAPRPLNSTIYFCKGEQTSRSIEFADPDLGLLTLRAQLVDDPKNSEGILDQLELTTSGKFYLSWPQLMSNFYTVVHFTIIYLGAELKLQSKSKIKAGTSWSVLIKYSDEGNKEDVSKIFRLIFNPATPECSIFVTNGI